MARPPRRNDGTRPVHVFANAVAGDVLFPDDGACAMFWEALGTAANAHGVRISQLCLMSTHYHLLAQGNADALSAAVQRAHGRLAWYRNRGDRRRGTLFARRYAVLPIVDPRHLANVVRYVPRNPVKAGLCDVPGAWRWSTHRALAGIEAPPEWLDCADALRISGFLDSRSYRRFVETDDQIDAPPLNADALLTYRIRRLAEGGMGDRVIAENLGVTLRRVRSALRDSGIEWHRTCGNVLT